MNCSTCGKFRKPASCKYCSSHKKKGDGFFDEIRNIGRTIGKPFEPVAGLNPFDIGYTIGHDFLGPKLAGKGTRLRKKK